LSIQSIGRADTQAAFAPKRSVSSAESISPIALLADASIIVATSIFCGTLFHLYTRDISGDLKAFIATGLITAALYCGLVRIWGSLPSARPSSSAYRAREAVLAWCLSFLFLVVLAFALKISSQFSRGTIFSFFATGLFAVTWSRVAIPRLLSQLSFANAYRGQEVIIAAPSTASTAALRTSLELLGCTNTKLIEFDDDPATRHSWPHQVKILAHRLFETARAAAPGEIYVMPGRLPHEAIEALFARLRLIPRAVYFVPDEQISTLLRHSVQAVGRQPVLEVQKSPLSRSERAVKRFFDVIVSASVLVFLLPLFVLVSFLIKLDDPKGPIFFAQNRLGYRGRPFRILKFRTMRVMEDGAVVTQASRSDQRVTRMGRFLRQSSIDELPQLINVLKGNMSLIGPRPHAVAHDEMYRTVIEDYEVRQHVKPGITGWAQVHGLRGATPHVDLMYRRIEMDIWYATHCSLGLDAQIFLRTFIEVFRQRNAY
jgi:Undecaprenyl-phosphate glucose phosphotransferase